jgi:hypothetical protein
MGDSSIVLDDADEAGNAEGQDDSRHGDRHDQLEQRESL